RSRFHSEGVSAEPCLRGPERDIDDADQDRNLDEGADDPSQGLSAGSAEGADSDGNREFEAVAGCRKRQCCGSSVAKTYALAEQEPGEPHQREVDQQWQ